MVAITRKMHRFDKAARRATTAAAIAAAWQRCMGTRLSDKAALNFLRHYKSMGTRKAKKAQRGGASYFLGGAPADYAMGPGQAGSVQTAGFPIQAAFGATPYGSFHDDVTANPTLLKNVGGPAEIFEIAQTKDCGVDRFPTDTRLAQSGGSRKKNRKGSRKGSRKGRKSSRKSGRKSSRRQRGGYLSWSLLHPLLPLGGDGVVTNTPEKMDHQWTDKWQGASPVMVAGVNQLSGDNPPMVWGPSGQAGLSGGMFAAATVNGAA